MENSREIAAAVLEKVGGKENITFLVHCATRLRFNLKDESKADIEGIKSIKGIWGVNKQNGQLQVIVGETVSDVYKEVCDMTGIEKMQEVEADDLPPEQKKKFRPGVIFDVLSACFGPLIPAFAGAGIIKGILTFVATYGLISKESGIYFLLNAAGDVTFYFLPFLLAYTAAKKFKTNEVVAMLMAGIYLYPTVIAGADTNIMIFGISVRLLKYSSTVLPILLSVWIMSYIYKWVYKHTVAYLRMIVVPIVVLLIMTPLNIIVFGPLGYYAGLGLGKLFSLLFAFSPLLAGILIGSTRPFVILTGMHMAVAPVMINNIATLGYDMIGPVNCVATMAAAGMCFGVFLRARRADNKTAFLSAFISGFIGITEPALYGVAFRFKKPLYACMIGGGVAGAVVAVMGGRAVSYAMPSIISLPAYTGTIPVMLIGLVIAFVVSSVCAYIFGINEDIEKDSRAIEAEKKGIQLK